MSEIGINSNNIQFLPLRESKKLNGPVSDIPVTPFIPADTNIAASDYFGPVTGNISLFEAQKAEEPSNNLPPVEIMAEDKSPAWTEKQKSSRVKVFEAGLKANNIDLKELNTLLKKHSITSLEFSAETAATGKYFNEFKNIQGRINEAIGVKAKPDGYIGKDTITSLLKLDAAVKEIEKRSEKIDFDIKVLGQVGKFECHDATMAGNLNFMLGKTEANSFTEYHVDAYNNLYVGKMLNDLGFENVIPQSLKENSDGSVTMTREDAFKIVEAIDEQLESGNRGESVKRGVMVGTSYRVWDDGNQNIDGATDHWILITGRGKDEKGIYYKYNDTVRDKETMERGTKGVLRLDPVSGLLSGETHRLGRGDFTYNVTRAKVFTNAKPEVAELYKNIGSPLFYYGQEKQGLGSIRYMLNITGYDTKGESSFFDNSTKKAVNDFQQSLNMEPINAVDSFTLEKLKQAFHEHLSANPDSVFFEKGKAGNKEIVSEIQGQLKDLGFYKIRIDGDYGNGTEKALKAFQQANNLDVTGKLDGKTWLKIIESVRNKSNNQS